MIYDPTANPVNIAASHFGWSRTFGAGRESSDELAGIYSSYDMTVMTPVRWTP